MLQRGMERNDKSDQMENIGKSGIRTPRRKEEKKEETKEKVRTMGATPARVIPPQSPKPPTPMPPSMIGNDRREEIVDEQVEKGNPMGRKG